MTQPLPTSNPTLGSLSLKWSLLGERELAGGRIVWLRIDEAARTVHVPKAIEALQVEETGDVPRLLVKNLLDQPVLLAGNLVVKGGWQTRTIERSWVLAPAAEALVPVRCVEAGRWRPRSADDARSFREADSLGISMRRRTTTAKSASVRRTGAYTAPQDAVWSGVDRELADRGAASPTSSYEAVLDGERRTHREHVEREAVVPPEGCNATMVVPADGGWWLEAFPSEAALREQLGRILPDLYEGAAATSSAAKVDVPKAMTAVWRERLRPLDRIAGALGDSYAIASTRRGGEVVLLDGALAHLSAGAVG